MRNLRVGNIIEKYCLVILVGIIILAAFVRQYRIDNPLADWHSWRQSDTAAVTRIYLDNGLDIFHPRYYDISYLQTGIENPDGLRYVEFPVFNVLHYFIAKLFSSINVETIGRELSVLCSLVSLIFIYLIGKRFMGIGGGLLASFLFALNPFNIYFSRVILPEPLAVTFSVGAVYFFIRWYDKSKILDIIVSALLFSLAMLVKPYAIFYAIPLLWLSGEKHSWQLKKLLKDVHLWIFAVISLLPLLSWRVFISQYPEGIPYYKWLFNNAGIRFKPAFWRWLFGERIGHMILGGWGLLGFCVGLVSKVNRREEYFFLSFGVGMFLYLAVIAAANVRHDYYQTLIIPAIVLIWARGILYLWNTSDLIQPLTKIISIVSIIFAIYFSWFTISPFYQINNPVILKAGNALDSIAPKDAVVIAPYNGDTAFLYQTKRFGWPKQTHAIEHHVSLGADYYVSVNFNDEMTQDAMRKFEIPIQTEEFVIIDLNNKRKPKN